MRTRWLICAMGTSLAVATSAPGAHAIDDPTATEFTAGTRVTAIADPGTMEFGEAAIRYQGLVEEGVITEPSDARFSGTFTWTGNRDQYSDPVRFSIWSGAYRIENDEGAWQERPSVWLVSTDDLRSVTLVFDGEGAYDGFTAVAELVPWQGMDFDGVIFAGDVPPTPIPEPALGAEPEAAE